MTLGQRYTRLKRRIHAYFHVPTPPHEWCHKDCIPKDEWYKELKRLQGLSIIMQRERKAMLTAKEVYFAHQWECQHCGKIMPF